MQTAPCSPLITFEGEGEERNKIETPQHSHQCGWCGRFFGEFTDQECKTTHASQRCTLECEQEQPARLFDPNSPGQAIVLDNAVAKANYAKLKLKEK